MYFSKQFRSVETLALEVSFIKIWRATRNRDWIHFKNTYASVIASKKMSSLSITQLLLLVTFLIELHTPNAKEQDLKDMFEHVKTIFVSNEILHYYNTCVIMQASLQYK